MVFNADPGQGDIAGRVGGRDVEYAFLAAVEPHIEAAEIAGCQGIETDAVVALDGNRAVVVPGVYFLHPLDAGVREPDRPAPVGLTLAAPVFGPLPNYPDAVAEVRGRVGAQGFHRLPGVQDVDAEDWRMSFTSISTSTSLASVRTMSPIIASVTGWGEVS